MFEVRVYHQEADEYNGLFPPDDYGNNFETVVKSTKPCSYLSFDGNGINLIDNNLKFYEDGDFLGYVLPFESSSTPNEYGNYPIDQSWPLIFNFTDVLVTPKHITIFCKEECIGGYNAIITLMENGKAVTRTVEEREYSGDKVVLELPDNVTYVEFYFLSASAPNKYITISSVFYGTFEIYDQFKSRNLWEEINVLSDDLPISQFEATIIVPDGDNVKFAKKDPLTIFSNHKYYGTYYIMSVQRVSKNSFEITAQDVLSIYDGSNFENWQPDTADKKVLVADIVEEIEKQTKLKLDTEGINTGWYIVGDKKDGSCRLALCELGYCFNKIVNPTRKDHVTFQSVPTTVTSEFLSDRILGDATLTKNDEISTAEIYYTRFEGIDNTESYQQEINGNIGDIITLTFPIPVYVDDAFLTTGVEILSCTLYSCKVKLTATTAKVFYYERLRLEESVTVTNPNAEINNTRKFYNITLKQFGDKNTKAYYVNKFINSRGTVRGTVRLRDEKVGDLVKIETAWDGIITGIITRMNIKFGYEDIADIEVLEWSI